MTSCLLSLKILMNVKKTQLFAQRLVQLVSISRALTLASPETRVLHLARQSHVRQDINSTQLSRRVKVS